MQRLKKFEQFVNELTVNAAGELVDDSGTPVTTLQPTGETEQPLRVEYVLNNEQETVFRSHVEIEPPLDLETIRTTLQRLEDKTAAQGLWLDAKFNFDGDWYSYNAGILIPSDDTGIGGQLQPVDV